MPYVVLQQISNEFARKNAKATLEKEIALRIYEKWLEPGCAEELRKLSPDGLIRVWGAKRERGHQFVKMPARSSLVLFRKSKRIVYHGAIAATTDNEELAKRFWGVDPTDQQTWPLIYFLTRLTPISKDAATFNGFLGRKASYSWQGMTSLYIEDSPKLQAYFRDQLNLQTPPDDGQAPGQLVEPY